MKFELTHDIIAEKIWAQLPEHDKMFRTIQHSVNRRQQDYNLRNGSLLSKKEFEEWKIYFKKGSWEKVDVDFIAKSKKAIIQQQKKVQEQQLEKERLLKKKNRNLRLFILALVIGFISVATIGYFNYRLAQKNHEIAFENMLRQSKEWKVQYNYSLAQKMLVLPEGFEVSAQEEKLLSKEKSTLNSLEKLYQNHQNQIDKDSLHLAVEVAQQMYSQDTDTSIQDLLQQTQKQLKERYQTLLTEARTQDQKSKSGNMTARSIALRKYREAYRLKASDKDLKITIDSLQRLN